ncbi:MAG: cation diffusion facilitator family transporter [Thermoanaerobaculia bacterium]
MMAHIHGQGSDPGSSALFQHRGRLAWALALTTLYMVAEALGGLWTGSLALLADAAHMLSDAAALGLSLFAVWMARKPPTANHSFGFYRTEILAAAANAAALIAISFFIFLEAWQRWQEPREVRGLEMMAIAAGGLVINLVVLKILSRGRSESLNLRGAWLHVLTDTLGSLQALIAGFLIWQLGWTLADPIASVLIGALVIFSAWSLLKDAVGVLMEGTPAHIDLDVVRRAIRELPGVHSVHDLHVWTITSGMDTLSAHVVCEQTMAPELLARIRETLCQRFAIEHQTIQLEPRDFEEHQSPGCP